MSRATCIHCGYVPDPDAYCLASDPAEPLHCDTESDHETSASDATDLPVASCEAPPATPGAAKGPGAPQGAGSCMICDDDGRDENGAGCAMTLRDITIPVPGSYGDLSYTLLVRVDHDDVCGGYWTELEGGTARGRHGEYELRRARVERIERAYAEQIHKAAGEPMEGSYEP